MKVQEFNDQVSEKRAHNKGNWEREQRLQLALDMIGKGKKVLDLACHDGKLSERIKDRGNEVVGLEISKYGAEKTRERGIECLQHNLEEAMPIEDNTFDVVFAGEIVEHIYDTDTFLQEIYRVLKDDGFLVLTTPNIAALSRRIRLALGVNPQIDIGLKGCAGHIRYFTRKSLTKLLARNKFSLVSMQGDFIALHKLRDKHLVKAFPGLATSIIVKAKKM